MNEKYNLKEIIFTWVCYSIALVCSILISVGLHIIAGIENEILSPISMIIVTKALTLIYRLVFENQELTAENILLIDSEINLDLFRFFLMFFVFFTILKIPVTILNFIILVGLFILTLILI